MRKKYKLFSVLCAFLVGVFSFSYVPLSYIASAMVDEEYDGGGSVVVNDMYSYTNLYSIFDLWFLFQNGYVNNASDYALLYLETPESVVSSREIVDGSEISPSFSSVSVNGGDIDSVIDPLAANLALFDDGYSALYDVSFHPCFPAFSDLVSSDSMSWLYMQIGSFDRYVLTPDIYELIFGGNTRISFYLNDYLAVKNIKFSANFKYLTNDGEFSVVEYAYNIIYNWDNLDPYYFPEYVMSYFMPSLDRLRSDGCIIGDMEYIYLDSISFTMYLDPALIPDSWCYPFISLYSDKPPIVASDDWLELQNAGLMYSATDCNEYVDDASGIIWANVLGFFDIVLFDGFKIYHLLFIAMGCMVTVIALKFILKE